MKLRLLMLEECNRTCKGCCNKEHDLAALPVCESFVGYSEIILTGGEPLLNLGLLFATIERIRAQTDAPIYLYTAWRENPYDLLDVLNMVDGITLTLHTRKDTVPFEHFVRVERAWRKVLGEKSLRLNVFRGVSTGAADLTNWVVKRDMRWIKDCPIPADEVFMRLPGALA